MNKTRSNNSEKWRHARTSIEIARTNEQKADLKWLWRHMVEQKSRRGNKNHEKANNSPSYRCAAIKNCQFYPKIAQILEVQMLKTIPLPQKKMR